METPTPTTGGNRTGRRKSSRLSITSNTQDPSAPSYCLDLNILTLKNVISKRYPIEVNISAYFKQRLLMTTPNFVIKNPGRYQIDYGFKFRVRKINSEMMDQMISEPLLIILTKLRHGYKNKYNYFSMSSFSRSRRFRNKLDLLMKTPKSPVMENKDTDNKEEKKTKRRIKKFKNDEDTTLPCTIGECTLDLLPLLQGQTTIKEELLLERPVRFNYIPLRMRPLVSRTSLTVSVSDTSDFTKNIPPLHNYLIYTVESMYNIDVDKLQLSELSTISASMPLPLNVPARVDERELSLFHFEPGVVSYNVNINYKKKWFRLANTIKGKGVYSKLRVPMGYEDIVNHTGVNLKENIESRRPRINWNIMRRIFLTPENEDVFIHNLIQYKCIPVEINFNSLVPLDLKRDSVESQTSAKKRLSGSGSKKSVRTRKGTPEEGPQGLTPSGPPLVAFVDISRLLSPGVKSTRVAAPVKYLTSSEYKEKWNVTESILKFNNDKRKGEKSEYEWKDLSLYGQNCFIIVEVSLMKPLVPEKQSLEWNKSLYQLATEKLVDSSLVKHKVPMDHFAMDTKFCIFLIKREMEDFYKLKHCEQYSEVAFYKNMDFWGHLGHSGAMKIINETLRKSIANYINNVLGAPQEECTPLEKKEHMENLFFKVIDKIHQVINSLQYSDISHVEKIVRHNFPSMDELLLYAVEAGEQLQYGKARYYLAKRMEINGYRNPDYWFDYGVMALRFGDMYLAMESMKEVLSIYPRHRMGLLVYAIILTVMGEYEEAEKFFYATLKFYPTFWQGWVTFHVFYKLIELYEGADITFVLGMRYMSEFPTKEEWQPHFPLLTWFTDVCNCFNVFLETAKFLLCYNLFEFAEMCLAEYLEAENKKDVCYYYYLAVCHFIQGRFTDSLVHLEELIEATGFENYKIWSLIGYNYHCLDDTEHARKAFLEAQKCLTDYSRVPLMLLRIGFDYIDRSCPEKGREMFLEALKWHSTPLAWIGLGVSYYLLEDSDMAEIAFLEANSLDPELAIVWTYLGLIFLQRHSLFSYVQCLLEAKKSGLEDKKLFDHLEILQDRLNVKSEESIQKNISHMTSINCFPKCCN